MSSDCIFTKLKSLFELDELPQLKLVAVRLVVYAGTDNAAWPCQSTLAQETGLSVRQVQRYLRRLVDLGALTIKRRKQAASVYSFDWNRVQELSQEATSVSHQEASRGDAHVASSEGKTRHQGRQDTTSMTPRCDTHVVQKDQERPLNTKSKEDSGLKTDKSKGGLWSIDPGEFKSLDRGHACFDRLVKSGTLRPEDELRFLTLWRWVGINRDRGPVAALRSCISVQEWKGTLEIEDEARAWLKSKRPSTDVGTLPGIQHLVESTAVDDLEDYYE